MYCLPYSQLKKAWAGLQPPLLQHCPNLESVVTIDLPTLDLKLHAAHSQ